MKAKPNKGIMNAFKHSMVPSIKMGGNKKMAGKALSKGNSAPKNFRPTGKK